jgi:hypothetical protein
VDKQAAEKMSAQLIGKTVGGWAIRRRVNFGKSAVVFEASQGGRNAALKVFDPEIVERYGREIQLKRVQRELALVGKSHPNLVTIFDGGEDGELIFVVMEYFDGRNLAERLPKVPASEMRSLIAQVASAAKFLEGRALAAAILLHSGRAPVATAQGMEQAVMAPLEELGSYLGCVGTYTSYGTLAGAGSGIVGAIFSDGVSIPIMALRGAGGGALSGLVKCAQ